MSILDSRLLGVACCIMCYSHSQVVATNFVCENDKKIESKRMPIMKNGRPTQSESISRDLKSENYSIVLDDFANNDDDGLIFHMDLDENPTNIASGDFGVQKKDN